MASKMGHSLSMIYKKMWNSFIFTNRGVAKYRPNDLNLSHKEEGESILLSSKEEEPILLIGWPWKYSENNKTTKRKLTIMIGMQQTISEHNSNAEVEYVVDKSCVNVTFYEYNPDYKSTEDILACSKVVEEIRFELDSEQKAHPFFHTHSSKLTQLRIATPPMDLRGVLFCLVANHIYFKIKDLEGNRFWKESQEELPHMPCHHIRDKIGSDRWLVDHWYI